MKSFAISVTLSAVTVCVLGILTSAASAQVPSSIADLELWLDAGDASTITTAGGFVTEWRDKSGNNFHATPTAAGHEPTVGVGVLGGQNAIRFSTAGTPDGMVINSPVGQFNRGANGYTIFIVDQYQEATGTSKNRTLQGRDGNNWLTGKWAGRNAHYAGNAFVYQVPGSHSTSIGEAIGGPTTVFGQPAGHANYHLDGLNVTQAASPNGQPGRLGIATGGQFSAETSDADVAEIIAYNRVLSWNERRDVGAYLETKYGTGSFYQSRIGESVSVGQITGAGATQGGDFNGHFQYAVDFGGTHAGTLSVGDADFVATNPGGPETPIPGVTFTAPNHIGPGGWGAPNFGAGADDNNLETVMSSIRWQGGNHVLVDMAGLTPGQDYQLQLLFGENCCNNRGFQVEVDGSIIAPAFNPAAVQGGASATRTAGGIATYQLFAKDSDVNIRLLSLGGFVDGNPILNGATLEFFPDAIASTSVPDGGTIDFSADLVIGPDMDTQTLTITNTGEALSELVLNDLFLTGDPEFSVTLDDGTTPFSPGTTLAQGEMLDLLIHFDGSDADIGDTFAGLLELDTNSGATFGSLDGQNLFFNLNAVVTPEPTSIAVWTLLGLIGLGWWRVRGR